MFSVSKYDVHEELLLKALNIIVQEKNIKYNADYIEFPGKDKQLKLSHDNLVCDIKVLSKGKVIIYEVKPFDQIKRSHTFNQLKVFLKYADKVILVTQKAFAERAKYLLMSRGLYDRVGLMLI